MNILKRSKLFLPLVIVLVMLAAFALPTPAFAEEGETPPVDPPAAESQGGISTGEPAEEPVNRIPEYGHEPQAPDEDPVIVRVEEPVAPVEETPVKQRLWWKPRHQMHRKRKPRLKLEHQSRWFQPRNRVKGRYQRNTTLLY